MILKARDLAFHCASQCRAQLMLHTYKKLAINPRVVLKDWPRYIILRLHRQLNNPTGLMAPKDAPKS